MAKYQKIYAVRKGRNTGIFMSWEECLEQVKGFAGAEYKSFPYYEVENATEYLNADKAPKPEVLSDADLPTDGVVAFVDGSFSKKLNNYSCGVVLFDTDGKRYTISKAGENKDAVSLRNVAGEIMGATLAMQYCVKHKRKKLYIFYDYQGIEYWCNGAWSTGNPVTFNYAKYYYQVRESVQIEFVKVKAHSNVQYNELADRLAKKALGIEVRI